MTTAKKKRGLYANIHAKQERIAHGSGEKMRAPGSAGAPSDKSFAAAAKKKPARKTSARKTPAKKTAARKSVAKKAPARKAAGRKKASA